MAYFNNIRLIGSSHIAKESIEFIKSVIKVGQPDIIAVELDKGRLGSLLSNEQSLDWRIVFRIGLKGFLFALIGSYVQKKLGKTVGVMPGADMLAAIKEAKANDKQLELIDQNIEITLARFSKALTWKERWNFIADIFNALFFRKREMKRLGLENLDLSKVPSEKIIRKMIDGIKVRYPNIYRVLIDERNKFMASRLYILSRQNPTKKILAVVGAGHEEGMMEELGILEKNNIKIQ